MNRLRVILFGIYNLLLIVAVVLVVRACFIPAQEPVVITRDEVRYNTIERDPGKLAPDQVRQELQCYYTSEPLLDIDYNTDGEYTLKAGLCDREWSRKVSIRPRDSPRNMVIAGPLISIRGGVGAWGQYYRLYGRFGIGGGVSLCRDSALAQAGVLWMW